MTFRKSSSEMNVMPHLWVVAFSSRGSLSATGRLCTSMVGRLRLWASSGALGVVLIILRCKVLSPLGSAVELWTSDVSKPILGLNELRYHALS